MIDLIDFSKKIKKLNGGSGQETYIIEKNGSQLLRKTHDKNDSRKIRNQVRWFIKNNNPHTPTVSNYGDSLFVFYYDIPYYKDYIPFSDYILTQDIEKSKNLLKDILHFMFRNFYQYEESSNMSLKLDDYLKTRLIDRLQNIAEINQKIADLNRYNEIIINGVSYPGAAEVVNKIVQLKDKIAKLSSRAVLNLHGDFTAENILCKDRDFILVDPDESPFNSELVDIGKLFQSLHSKYELLTKIDKCEVKGISISFPEPQNSNYDAIFDFLDKEVIKYIPKEQYPLIIFNEAMHFARMLPYKHKINPDLVPIFYGNTIKLLNLFIQSFKG